MSKVGGEVDAWCSKCELTLAHTVIAMMGGRPVKVECNTCHGVHRFRGVPDGAVPRGGSVAMAKAARPAREKRVEIDFADVLATKQRAPVAYSPKRTFQVDDVVDHPTFGRGYVTVARPDKVEIAFRSDVKTLIHARA
jgi:hypothetical protein